MLLEVQATVPPATLGDGAGSYAEILRFAQNDRGPLRMEGGRSEWQEGAQNDTGGHCPPGRPLVAVYVVAGEDVHVHEVVAAGGVLAEDDAL